MTRTTENDDIRQAVRKNYGQRVVTKDTGSGCAPSGCCDTPVNLTFDKISMALGYSKEDVEAVPEGANLGLGCGNPQAIASLRPGETVLDLGSGGGFDCFLAARAVGEDGRVIGIDMTAEMISTSRRNAEKAGFANVEFRLGEIEHLPVADASVDVIISNCVINLSPEKDLVFNESFRVLKPGGRLAISDVVATAELPAEVRRDMALYSSCVSGASTIHEIEKFLTDAGFEDIRIEPKEASREFIREWAPGRKLEEYVLSATIEARKPMA